MNDDLQREADERLREALLRNVEEDLSGLLRGVEEEQGSLDELLARIEEEQGSLDELLRRLHRPSLFAALAVVAEELPGAGEALAELLRGRPDGAELLAALEGRR